VIRASEAQTLRVEGVTLPLMYFGLLKNKGEHEEIGSTLFSFTGSIGKLVGGEGSFTVRKVQGVRGSSFEGRVEYVTDLYAARGIRYNKKKRKRGGGKR